MKSEIEQAFHIDEKNLSNSVPYLSLEEKRSRYKSISYNLLINYPFCRYMTNQKSRNVALSAFWLNYYCPFCSAGE